jgi:hypothetical protein
MLAAEVTTDIQINGAQAARQVLRKTLEDHKLTATEKQGQERELLPFYSIRIDPSEQMASLGVLRRT